MSAPTQQPTAKPEYGGRVLIDKECYLEIQRDAIENHCRNCFAEGKITSINKGDTSCEVCGASDIED